MSHLFALFLLRLLIVDAVCNKFLLLSPRELGEGGSVTACHCTSLKNKNKLHHLTNSVGIQTTGSHSVYVPGWLASTSDRTAEQCQQYSCLPPISQSTAKD